MHPHRGLLIFSAQTAVRRRDRRFFSGPFPKFFLFFVADLKNVKLQIVGLIRRPENWMVGRLRAVFHLAQPPADIVRGLIPVSYTHLDVYKRQVVIAAAKQLEIGKAGASHLFQ